MATLIENGEVRLEIRTKLNNLAGMLIVAETDTAIPAEACTSVPIVTSTVNIPDNSTIYLIDKTTGESHALTLDTALASGEDAITIVSHTFASIVPVGSMILYPMTALMNRVYLIENPL